jgi:DNA-directed RNA polymerase specialized sigma24 family protein
MAAIDSPAVQAALGRNFRDAGARRIALKEQMTAVDEELRPLVFWAYRHGHSLRQIAAQTGLSVATVRVWVAGGES